MVPRIVIWHSSGSTTARDAVRTALGIASLAFTAFSGAHYIEVLPRTDQTQNEFAAFAKNYQAMIDAGCFVQLKTSTGGESLTTLRAGFTGSAGIDAGSSAPIYLTGNTATVIAGMVFDCRSTGREAFVTGDQARNVTFANCIFFEPQGTAPDRDHTNAVDATQTEGAVTLSRCEDWRFLSCWWAGGKAYAHLQIMRSNRVLVEDCVFVGDSRMRWGLVDVGPGDPWLYPDTCARYGYVFDGGRRPFRHGTNLRGNMGTRDDIACVNNAGGSARVRLDWSLWTRSGSPAPRDQVDNHLGDWRERNVWLDWDGAPDGLTFHWISVDYAAKSAVVEARLNGVPYTVPAGFVSWHIWQHDYSPVGIIFRRCTFLGLSAADRPRLSGISIYNGVDCHIVFCRGGNVGDYVAGIEADCLRCTIQYCVDLGGTAGSAFEVVFAAWDCRISYCYSPDRAIYALAWGRPQVGVVIDGWQGLVNDRHEAATMPSTRSRVTNMFRRSRLNRAAISGPMVTVSPALLSAEVPVTNAAA